MRTAITPLTLIEPNSLTHALRLLRDEPPLVPIAGCTDLYVALNAGTLSDRRFLNLWRLEELRGIRMRGTTMSIGALSTFTDIMQSRLVRRRLPMLVAASREVGGVQIHNRGTIGGNIANASPAGDTLPVLAVAEATVVLRRAGAERRVPFNQFYVGYRRTVMQPDELIVTIEIPRLEGRQWFRKVGTRSAQAISKVVIAGIRAPEPRIGLGSVAPTVVRARTAERVLAARGALSEACEALLSEIAPIDDARSSARYRSQVAANLLAQFWRETS